jgi:DNA invertase Pin-like site-specific DNA recombinase
MTIAFIYVRQSRHRDAERTVSPEVQEDACRALPAVRACDQVEVFKDLNVSGGKLKGRRAFIEMLRRISTAQPTVVAAYDQSRSFRNTTDALEFYALMERRAEVEVVFVHGRFDRTPAGEFTYTTLAAAHAMERRMTGQKIGDAVRHLAAQGRMVGQVPAGYVRRSDGTVEIDEDAAAVIRHVFDLYATGRHSTGVIAQRLNAEGVQLPRNRGAPWRWHTVAEMLRNIAYTGRSRVGSRRRRGTGEIIENAWPAIVSPELWDHVQELMEKSKWRGGRRPADQERPYVFRGLLRCSCGARLHCVTRKNEVRFYECRQGRDTDPPCFERPVREDRILPWARALFTHLDELKPDDFEELVAERVAAPRQLSPDAVASIDRYLERAEQLFLMGRRDEAWLRAEVGRLERLKNELSAEQTRQPTIPLGSLLGFWQNGDAITRRQLLATLFAELHLSGGHVIGYTPAPANEAEVIAIMGALHRRGAGLGGDGVEPTASAV